MPAQPEPFAPECAHRLPKPLANERGVALLLALAMLAIMTVIGVFALDTSTTEVQISGNYRTSQDAFFGADRAAMFALGHANFEYLQPNPSDPNDPDLKTKNTRLIHSFGTGDQTGSKIVAAGSSYTTLKNGTVECIFEGTEVGAGMGGAIKVGYYLINATVAGPNGSESRIEVQSKYQTLVPEGYSF